MFHKEPHGSSAAFPHGVRDIGHAPARPTETWVSVCVEPEAEVSSCVHTKFGRNPLGVDGKLATGSSSEWTEGPSVGPCLVAERSMGPSGRVANTGGNNDETSTFWSEVGRQFHLHDGQRRCRSGCCRRLRDLAYRRRTARWLATWAL